MLEPLIALVALSLMEIVLGIDNIVFISVATSKLPADQQSAARRLGLLVALGTRLLLLCGIFWIAQLVTPVFSLSSIVPQIDGLKRYYVIEPEHDAAGGHGISFGSPSGTESGESAEHATAPEFDKRAWEEFNEVSWRDIILMLGGLFLIYSSVHEIHNEVEHQDDGLHLDSAKQTVSFRKVLIQVGLMDLIFSLDSVITAVGMANQLWVMVVAVIIAVGVMIIFANQVGNFVDQNPTIKMLALAFLLLIGVMLVAEGIGTPISKGYIYFAMCFSLLVEVFNMQVRKRREQAAAAD